jgi:hypothetical protein
MPELDRVAERTSTALRGTLGRLTRLVRGLCIGACIVGAATYVTLLWVTDGEDWVLLGAVICAAPLVAGLLAFWRLSSTLHVAPKALDDLRTVLRDRKATTAMGPLFDHDTQQPIGLSARNMSGIRAELRTRRKELPALFSTVQALVTVPGLAALAVIGTLLLGMVGTIMLIVGLLD